MKRLLLFSTLILLLTVAGAGYYVEQRLQESGPSAPGLVEIPKGLRAREVLALLENRGVIADQNIALGYLIYTNSRGRLQAGEYMFDRPMTIPEVVRKLISGAVHLRKFTVPEGLTVADTAAEWERQGFGKAAEFLEAANSSLELIRPFDEVSASVEGYLFPETYLFPSRTTARQAVASMVNRFRQMAEKLEAIVPKENWPLSLRETVVLASLVETEASVASERPLVASVYLNRLNKKILLQCDPTVIYALEQANLYRGSLTLADLKFKSPYNTYVNSGLPPGAIANPGYAALLASVQPAETSYLFFVRTIDGRHTFSENLAAHNRAVAAYRKLQRAARQPKAYM